MAPSYDGKDPKQIYHWLDEVARLSTQYGISCLEVAHVTSRGSVHRYIQELKLQGLDWNVIKVKLRERFSDCTSSAAAQNRLSSLKQDGRPMHEYISHFSDILEHAYGLTASDPATKLLANQFIEGIDVSNKYTKNKLREKSGTNLDYYFQEAMRLQHKQEIRTIDFGQDTQTQVSECSDILAIRSNPQVCFNCKSPDHFIRECPEEKKQIPGNNRPLTKVDEALELLKEAFKSLGNNQATHGFNRPNQHSHSSRFNPQAKPSHKPPFKPQYNRGKTFKENSQYQRPTVNTNAIEDFEPQHESDYCDQDNDSDSPDPSEDQSKN